LHTKSYDLYLTLWSCVTVDPFVLFMEVSDGIDEKRHVQFVTLTAVAKVRAALDLGMRRLSTGASLQRFKQ
jgi:hypothetical protein